MPSSLVRSFTDPDEFAASVRYASVNLHVLERGLFAAKLVRIDFHKLWLQRFSDSLPRVASNSLPGGRAVVDSGTGWPSTLVRGGVELNPKRMSRLRADEFYYERTSGPTSTAAMSLPVEDMVAYGAAVLGRDLHPPSDRKILMPPLPAMERFQRLHAAAGALAEDVPTVIANPETARALEQALIDAMLNCLGAEESEGDRAAQRRHADIMRRFQRVIDASTDQPVYLPALCREIGASERTLRGLLRGASRHGAEALSSAASNALGPPRFARKQSRRHDRHRDRDAIWVLAVR
jgi:hypothetical protein